MLHFQEGHSQSATRPHTVLKLPHIAVTERCALHAQADKLLSPEFHQSLEDIISRLKPGRQIMLYSATFPVTVKDFRDKHLNRPAIINKMEELTLRGISQYYAFVQVRSPNKLPTPDQTCCLLRAWNPPQ